MMVWLIVVSLALVHHQQVPLGALATEAVQVRNSLMPVWKPGARNTAETSMLTFPPFVTR